VPDPGRDRGEQRQHAHCKGAPGEAVRSRRIGQNGLWIGISKPSRGGWRCNRSREGRPRSREGRGRSRERRPDVRKLRMRARPRARRQLRLRLERGTLRRLRQRRRGHRTSGDGPRLAQRGRLGGAGRRGGGRHRGHRRRRRGLNGGRRWLTRRGRRARVGRGLRRGVGRRRRRGERRQEEHRVEVALLVAEHADAQLDVRDRVRNQAARADDRDGLALRHGRALHDQERAEMQQGDGIAVGGFDCDRQPVGRDPADEADGSRARREHLAAERALDVDSAVLARRERIVGGEGEALQHRPWNRPRPCRGHGG
jgi:hypothetical protein